MNEPDKEAANRHDAAQTLHGMLGPDTSRQRSADMQR